MFCLLSFFLSFLFQLIPSNFHLPLTENIRDTMAVTEKNRAQASENGVRNSTEIDTVRQEAALGHKQELSRNFGLWSVTSLGIVIAK
jgi:hypothetical protein